MRIVVTGAAGFIGYHVARRLAQQGHEVHALVRRKSPDLLANDAITVSIADLADRSTVTAALAAIRPDCAVHLAWYAEPGRYWQSAENLASVRASLVFVEALATSGCGRLVAAGSCAEYDWSHSLLSESATPIAPSSLYGVCKDATRRILSQYCETSSIEFAWARFFFLYGPREAPGRLV